MAKMTTMTPRKMMTKTMGTLNPILWVRIPMVMISRMKAVTMMRMMIKRDGNWFCELPAINLILAHYFCMSLKRNSK